MPGGSIGRAIKRMKRERDAPPVVFMAAKARPKKRRGYRTVARTRGVYAEGEMKYFDTERTSTALPASTNWTATEFPPNVGTPNTLVVPVVGSAINNRIGRMIKLLKLTVKGVIYVASQTNQGTNDNPSLCRVALVQDCQTNGAQAQGEDIFAAPTNAQPFNTVCSFQSLANLGRFKVWKDKWINLQNPNCSFDATNIEQAGLIKPFKFSLKFKNPIVVHFNAANGGTISDIVDHSFSIYATTTDTQLAPAIAYSARAYYKE